SWKNSSCASGSSMSRYTWLRRMSLAVAGVSSGPPGIDTFPTGARSDPSATGSTDTTPSTSPPTPCAHTARAVAAPPGKGGVAGGVRGELRPAWYRYIPDRSKERSERNRIDGHDAVNLAANVLRPHRSRHFRRSRKVGCEGHVLHVAAHPHAVERLLRVSQI